MAGVIHYAARRYPIERAAQASREQRRFLLPAGEGAFACKLIFSTHEANDGPGCHVRAETWLHRDQFFPEQEAALVNCEGEAGLRLGDTWLLPGPLRRFQKDGQVLVWTPGSNVDLASHRSKS